MPPVPFRLPGIVQTVVQVPRADLLYCRVGRDRRGHRSAGDQDTVQNIAERQRAVDQGEPPHGPCGRGRGLTWVYRLSLDRRSLAALLLRWVSDRHVHTGLSADLDDLAFGHLRLGELTELDDLLFAQLTRRCNPRLHYVPEKLLRKTARGWSFPIFPASTGLVGRLGAFAISAPALRAWRLSLATLGRLLSPGGACFGLAPLYGGRATRSSSMAGLARTLLG